MRFNPLRNLPLKIGAVLLAMLLWVHVATNKTFEYQIEMPLSLINVPAGLVQTNVLPATVTVRVKTSGKQLIALGTKQPQLRLNMAEYREGTFERELTDGDAMAAFDQVYEAVGIASPRKLSLRFERESEKGILVKSNVRIVPAPGFMIVGRPKIEPEMVNALGPASAIRKLRELETEAIEINGLTSTTTQQIRLVKLDSMGVKLADSLVRITVSVESMIEKILASQAIRPPQGFEASEYDFSPREATIRVGIPKSLLDTAPLKNVRVSFRNPDYESDSMRVALEVRLPAPIAYLSGGNDSIWVYRRR